jgi:hypothetical protein
VWLDWAKEHSGEWIVRQPANSGSATEPKTEMDDWMLMSGDKFPSTKRFQEILNKALQGHQLLTGLTENVVKEVVKQ